MRKSEPCPAPPNEKEAPKRLLTELGARRDEKRKKTAFHVFVARASVRERERWGGELGPFFSLSFSERNRVPWLIGVPGARVCFASLG